MLNVFESVSQQELKSLYENLIKSKELGIRPTLFDPYVKRLKDLCNFNAFSDATDFVISLFYQEVARRYFN